MAVLDNIRERVAARQYLLSKHAADQLITRDIAVVEVEQALLGAAELIEDYPLDKYGPSCLILGYTESGRALHVQCAHSDPTVVKIVTVYEPDPDRWIDMRTRRRG
jgi:hypothetical protein